jgi:hypothetical protein
LSKLRLVYDCSRFELTIIGEIRASSLRICRHHPAGAFTPSVGAFLERRSDSFWTSRSIDSTA